MEMQLALGVGVVGHISPTEVEVKIGHVKGAIEAMSLVQLSDFYEQLQRWPTTYEAYTSPLREVRWLNRHDGRQHKRRAIAAVRAEIEQRMKGGGQ